MRTRKRISLIMTMGALLMLALAGPASAGHRQDHKSDGTVSTSSKGSKSTKSPKSGAANGKKSIPAKGSASITEDNDSDGVPNNIVDDGDNRHPSGKDRSVENGKSGNQGNSTSTPDQNGKGPERDINGTDKPDGPGGMDIFDQDGNNGCGNDDDFDDDNEGRCLGRQGPGSDVEDSDDENGTVEEVEEQEEVLAETETGGSLGASVLGLFMAREAVGAAPTVAGAVLAFTGARADAIFALALALLMAGALLLRSARERTVPQQI